MGIYKTDHEFKSAELILEKEGKWLKGSSYFNMPNENTVVYERDDVLYEYNISEKTVSILEQKPYYSHSRKYKTTYENEYYSFKKRTEGVIIEKEYYSITDKSTGETVELSNDTLKKLSEQEPLSRLPKKSTRKLHIDWVYIVQDEIYLVVYVTNRQLMVVYEYDIKTGEMNYSTWTNFDAWEELGVELWVIVPEKKEE